MPRKPKRPCSQPGCPELTHQRFCVAHAKEEARRYERYQRDPATRKRYGRAWRRIRDRFIKANPMQFIKKADFKSLIETRWNL